MSFLKKLFGSGEATPKGPRFEAVEHEGYTIQPQPIPEGGQFRLQAMISCEINGEVREHRLIRADVFGDANTAAEFSIRKAKQLIAEQGAAIFG